MANEKDDPFELARQGLAKLSQLHPRHMNSYLRAALGSEKFFELAKMMNHDGAQHE
jgi:hypothetical protein